MSFAERLAFAPELRDITTWPTPRPGRLSTASSQLYERRKSAVAAYLTGASLKSIHTHFGVSKAELYRLIERCLTDNGSAGITGFQALVPGYAVARYTRTRSIDYASAKAGKGLVGALSQLIAESEELSSYIEKKALHSNAHSASSIAKGIHKEFLKRCAKIRAPNQYPFVTKDKGARALVQYIQRLQEQCFASSVEAKSAAEREQKLPLTGQPTSAPLLRPYEETEHDGHNGDFYFVIKTRGLQNEWITSAPLRIWLLLLICRSSRAILGYSYRFGSTNYSAIEVMRSIAFAIRPWVPKELTLPQLRYNEGAGFPSSAVPSCEGRLVDMVFFDNGTSNRAHIPVRALTRTMGATVNFGRVGTPTARPFIERLNQTLETTGFRRLPVGFDPNAPDEERAKAHKVAERYALTIDEFEQVIDVMLANYNAQPHSSLANRSPLQFIASWDAHSFAPIRRTPDASAFATQLLRVEVEKTIKGPAGRSPYVEAWNVRYSNDALRKMQHLVGKKIRLVAEVDGDMRFIRGFVCSGARFIDIGVLRAASPWHLTAHTLEQRRIICKEQRIHPFAVPPGTDMVMAFQALKQRQARDHKASANKLVHFGAVVSPQRPAVDPRTARKRVSEKEWIKL